MRSPLLRLFARAYPKGQQRSEFLESVASDLHYSAEVGVAAGQIRRGAVRQALAYAWRHPRVGAFSGLAGLAFSGWLGLMGSSHEYKVVALAGALGLMLSWAIAALVTRIGNGEHAKAALLGWALLAASFVVRLSEWHTIVSVPYCPSGAADCAPPIPFTISTRTDLSSFTWPLVVLSGVAYLWLAVLLFRSRAFTRGVTALLFAPVHAVTYFSLHRGLVPTVREVATKWSLVPLAVATVAWLVVFAAAFWQLGKRQGEAQQAQR